jgi:putative salt-induced outer membrane protein YdiY/sRNA-binding regulator protein Hfq
MNASVSRRLKCMRLFPICLALIAISFPTQAKTLRGDSVTMMNGDRLTGEVKKLQNGVLYFKTDYVDSNIAIDWNQIKAVETSATFQVTLVNGIHMTGKIRRVPGAPKTEEEFIIMAAGGDTRLPASAIAEISSQKDTFLRQLKGSIDVGYSFTSGNNQTTLNTDASATYTTPRWTIGESVSTSFSGQSGAARTNRLDDIISVERFLSRNSYLGGVNEYLHSSQQDLNLRITAGGGYGRYLIRTNTTNLRWIGGAVYTWEDYDQISGQPRNSNVEGLIGAAYDSYRFKFGEIHLRASLFPGLSDSGRIRSTTNNALKIKLTNNFYFTIGFWDNYDSRPPLTAKKNELGVSSSIGWSF